MRGRGGPGQHTRRALNQDGTPAAVDATYEADLHALNEINFPRFEAKLGERIAELRADLRTEF